VQDLRVGLMRPDEARRMLYLQTLIQAGHALLAARADALDKFRRAVTTDPEAFRARVQAGIERRLAQLGPERRARLDVLGVEPDLMGPLDQVRAETLHTRVIAWALSPARLSHGLGTAPLRALLDRLSLGVRFHDGVDLDGVRAVPEHSVGSHGRVDIWLPLPGLEVLIEAKIDHFEGEGQVAGYRRAFPSREVITVFLTLDGRPCESDPNAVPLSFRDLLAAWIPVAASGRTGEHDYLARYLKTVAVEFCDLADEGGFQEWPWARQIRTLEFVEGTSA